MQITDSTQNGFSRFAGGGRRALAGAFVPLLLGLRGQIPAAAQDTGIAYAWISSGANATVGSAQYQYNLGGGPISVTRANPGAYVVSFSGSTIGPGWGVQVSSYGSTGAYCKPTEWRDSTVLVNCFNPAGAQADSAFTVQAARAGNLMGIAFAAADSAGAALAPHMCPIRVEQ